MVRTAGVNLAWQTGHDAELIAAACDGADVVFVCEALTLNAEGPLDLRKILPIGWAVFQDLSSAARAGSAVCWRTSTMAEDGPGELFAGSPAGGGTRARHIASQRLRERATGDSRPYAAFHAPKRSTGLQDEFYASLDRYAANHPRAVLGGDCNRPPIEVAVLAGRRAVHSEVMGIFHPTNVPARALTPQANPWTDHPIVRAVLTLPIPAPPKEAPVANSEVIRVGTDPSGRPIYMTRLMQRVWAQILADPRIRPFAAKLVIVQGAFMSRVEGGGADASAGIHDEGGCLDVRTRLLTATELDLFIRVARENAFAFWRRDKLAAHGGMDPHAHGVLGADFLKSAGARAQWIEYLNGGDGLTGSRPDYEWRPSPLVTTPPPPPRIEEDEVSAQEVWNHPVPFTGDPDKVGDKRPVFISVVETHNAVEQIKDDVEYLKAADARQEKLLAAILAKLNEAG